MLTLRRKIVYSFSCIFIIVIIFVIWFLGSGTVYPQNEIAYGLTFSKKRAADLGFDWKQMYLAMVNELGVKKLRLVAYWDDIESQSGNYDFSDIDWQLEIARQNGIEVILAMGARLPRWPECHYPAWAKDLPAGERADHLYDYLAETIARYKSDKTIIAWQIENEPFLPHFGDCPKLDKSVLDQEIALTKRLDSRPIVVTDSGELSFWIEAAKRADIFGTTMYRDTYSKKLGAYIHYPISPAFFHYKKNITALFAHPKDWIVIELAAEPWTPIDYQFVPKEERDKTMSYDKFNEMLEFSRLAGFKTFYLWGVEYWYWEKAKNQDSSFWDKAKLLFAEKKREA